MFSIERFRRVHRDLVSRLAAVLGAVLLGIAAIAFAKLGDAVQVLFATAFGRWPWLASASTPVVFASVVKLTQMWFPEARGSGIPQVMAAGHNPAAGANSPLISLRTAIGKCAGTLAMLLAGGSVGREGPTVQISAALMVAVHRVLRVPVNAGVIIAGGAAGVAAAFNTPLSPGCPPQSADGTGSGQTGEEWRASQGSTCLGRLHLRW